MIFDVFNKKVFKEVYFNYCEVGSVFLIDGFFIDMSSFLDLS